jgi:hypothetical protein
MENPTQPTSEATPATHHLTDAAALTILASCLSQSFESNREWSKFGLDKDERACQEAELRDLEAAEAWLAKPATTDKQTLALETALRICKGDGAHALTPDEVDEVAYQLGRFLRRTLGCFAPVITPNDVRNSGNEGAETLTDEEAQDVCMIMDDNESTASTVNEAVAELVYQAIEDRKGDATK